MSNQMDGGNAGRSRILPIVSLMASFVALVFACVALLFALFPNMDKDVLVGNVTICDQTENPVIQIGPEFATDRTIKVRDPSGNGWLRVRVETTPVP